MERQERRRQPELPLRCLPPRHLAEPAGYQMREFGACGAGTEGHDDIFA